MNEQEMVLRKERMMKVAQIGIVGVTGFVIAPVIFLAIQGLVGLAVAGLVALAAVNAAPVAADRFSNWRLRELKAEAARNPIETLQTDFQSRKDALHSFRESITSFQAAVTTFGDKLDGFKAQFPNDADKFNDQLSKMKKLLEVRKRKYKEAEDAINQYSGEIQRAKAIWEMGQEAAKMNNAAGMKDEDFMAKIKVETALDSVISSMNTAFAELETSLLEEDGTFEAQRLIEAQHIIVLPSKNNREAVKK